MLLLLPTVCDFSDIYDFPFDYERQFVSEIQKASPPCEAGQLDMRTENPGLMWKSAKETRRTEQDPGSCRHATCILLGLKYRDTC